MADRFRITPRAKADLHGIWRYTRKTWNEAQADKYVTALYGRFARLGDRPQAGRHRPDICEGYHCFPQGAHLISYLVREDGIDIIGIPHKELDIQHFFE